MDSESLATFVAIHRAGGVSAAAERLHRSQPAISRRLALLEARLGAPLFERTASGLSLSQAGAALLPHAERALAALEDAAAAMADFAAGTAGPISLAVVGTLADARLSAVLRGFAEEAPGVPVHLRTATSAEVSRHVRAGEAALGLRYFRDRGPGLDQRPLAPEPLALVCAPDHPLAGRELAALDRLADARWLAFPHRAGRPEAATHIAPLFAARGIEAPEVTPVDSLSGQRALAAAGHGLALLPEGFAAEDLARGALGRIRVRGFAPANPVTLLTRSGGYLGPAARRLADLLAARF
ncbi:MAG: LysR family transcriptional regulator [Pseudomonadota bacterium]|nr:LysR family transcriptional regulator [Pseudomonadota bacterium]